MSWTIDNNIFIDNIYNNIDIDNIFHMILASNLMLLKNMLILDL